MSCIYWKCEHNIVILSSSVTVSMCVCVCMHVQAVMCACIHAWEHVTMCMSVCVTDLQLQWMCVLSVQGVEWGSMCVSMYLLVCTNVVAHGCMTPTLLSQTQGVRRLYFQKYGRNCGFSTLPPTPSHTHIIWLILVSMTPISGIQLEHWCQFATSAGHII